MPALLPSELPVRARTRHHWIVLWRLPHKLLMLALIVFVLAAVITPNPMAWLLTVFLIAFGFLRWQTWQAEQIILTNKRIIRVQGVPETTSSEASLRVDRISGSQYIVTVPGKIFRYGTIALEAPGDHPGTKHLIRISGARGFYEDLRQLVYGGPMPTAADPDFGQVRYTDVDEPQDYVTEPLPVLPPARERFGRRGY